MRVKIEKIRRKEPVNMRAVMLEAGFKPSTVRNPKNLTGSQGWEELKRIYLDDELALKTLGELSAPENEDKDNRLKASIEILKLNDRYPAQKSKVVGLFQSLESIEE